MRDGSAGYLLRQARHRARISQASVAALMGTSQARVSRWESGGVELFDDQLDEALAICGAQRSGPRSLSDLLTPLRGHDTLRWYAFQPPLERLRIASLHCRAAGEPLAGIAWPALLGTLKLVAGTADCAVSGAVARALGSPDRTRDDDLGCLDLRAPDASPAWALPARLPMIMVRVTLTDATEAAWRRWPMPKDWPGPLVVAAHDVQQDAERGRSDA